MDLLLKFQLIWRSILALLSVYMDFTHMLYICNSSHVEWMAGSFLETNTLRMVQINLNWNSCPVVSEVENV